MLDRNIPFYNLILKCSQYRQEATMLPDGYSIASYTCTYTHRYEKAWAQMEYAAGDFPSKEKAEAYFTSTYLQDRQQFQKIRFLLDGENQPIGSCIAWQEERNHIPVSSLHWLIVQETHQAIGLGKALCRDVMELFLTDGRMPVYIHTQPWSWKAVLLYISLGFQIQKTDTFSNYTNQYEQAMDVLKTVLDEKQYQLLLDHTED